MNDIYQNPLTKKLVSDIHKVKMNNREIPDFRFFINKTEDEYFEGDPYPKDEERERRLNSYVKNIIIPLLPELKQKKCTLLDAGCGTGDWLYHIYNESGINHKVFVAEYSELALAECINRNQFISEACLFDANYFPYQKNFFDIIISINLFEHIAAPILFLEKAIMSLKKDGVLLISTPSRYSYKNFIRVIRGKKTHLIHKLHVTEYTVGQVKEMVKFAGGKVTSIKGSALVVKEFKPYPLHYIVAHTMQMLLSHIIRSHHLFHNTVYYRIEKA